ncbi:protein NKG7 [Tachyglossus aculeatus]|uniref:protein NKG7 n=1 Tax=Tachyglossus aculeatus TaxID=9261 RepID=UPI0018F496C9|nr:protein NKG7 [Tachyglossus aculeatus]
MAYGMSAVPTPVKSCCSELVRRGGGYLKIVQILMVSSAIMGFLALVPNFRTLNRFLGIETTTWFSFLTCYITGLCPSAILGIAGQTMYMLKAYKRAVERFIHLNFDWAFYLGWGTFLMYLLSDTGVLHAKLPPPPELLGQEDRTAASSDSIRPDQWLLYRTLQSPHTLHHLDPCQSRSPRTREITSRMPDCRVAATLCGTLSLTFLVVALSTDAWVVANGPRNSIHAGLWGNCLNGDCILFKSYGNISINVTRAFTIISSICGVITVVFFIISFFPSLSSSLPYLPLTSCISAFTAGICGLVGMAVYTGEFWENSYSKPTIQVFFAWSFYLGWASVILFVMTGILSIFLPRGGYDSLG